MGIGKSEIELEESKIDVYINDIQIVADGKAISYNTLSVVSALGEDEVRIRLFKPRYRVWASMEL